MKWSKITPGDNPLLEARIGDYLFHDHESNPAGLDALVHLHTIAYLDEAAINICRFAEERQIVRPRDFYENGDWYYMPCPE